MQCKILKQRTRNGLTFNNDNALRSIWSQFVGSNHLVLAGVGRLGVDDLDGDDAVGVGDRELGRVKLFASLQPFDLNKAMEYLNRKGIKIQVYFLKLIFTLKKHWKSGRISTFCLFALHFTSIGLL